MRVFLDSLGCRLNSAEVELLARQFAGVGHSVADSPQGADIIVLNTCAVTARAARRSRHRVHTLHRQSPTADIAVTGCWATEDVDRAAEVEGVRWVVPNANKADAVARILGEPVAEPAPWAPGSWGHTRAFLGVQEGCDHACTYCIVRMLRGPARSRPLVDAVAEVQRLVARGAQEVVLTGVSLGAYGSDFGLDGGLAHLVVAILRETDLTWLRLSSIEPWDVTRDLLALWEDPRICGQLHVPVQSGSDAILKRMGRRHTVAEFCALVHAARDVRPGIAITTDVIAGFPGETEADFARTLSLVEDLRFARLHVFPYSDREGTPAARLPDSVPGGVRKERARQLRELGAWLGTAYREEFVGRRVPVLWMGRDGDGNWVGLTDNYLRVRTSTDRELYNRIVPARIVDEDGDVLVGEVVTD